MTRPEGGRSSQDQGQANPFDTGLPMLRRPAQPTGKRRRRGPGGRRRAPRSRPAPQVHPPEPLPEAGDATTGPSQRTGDWAGWLDPPPRAEPPPDTTAEQSWLPTREDPESAQDDNSHTNAPAVIDRTGGNPGPALRHPRQHRDQQRGNRPVAVLIMIGLTVAVGSILWAVLPGSGTRSGATATTSAPAPRAVASTPPPTGPADSPSGVAASGCEQRRTADVISGTDPGGTSDGPSAILAFERAYYVQRSGYAARAVVADHATVPPAEQIQRGIDQIPLGTRYCVQITRVAGDGDAQWEVRLTQQFPGQQPRIFTQIITTRTVASQTLITAISVA